MSELMPGAEPFHYDGGDVGCLLVHGLTATPQEMGGVGRFLADQGLTVHGVLLAGHGTQPTDLDRTTWRDWYTSVRIGHERLARRCRQLFAIGLSVGGALVLHLAAHETERVAGVVAMATPLYLTNPLLLAAPALRLFVSSIRKRPGKDWHDQGAAARRVAYDRYPLAAVEQLLAFQQHLRDDLPEIRVPTLLMHSRADQRVDPANMPLIFDLISSQDKRMVWLEKCNHIVTEDGASERVWQLCLQFVLEHTRP